MELFFNQILKKILRGQKDFVLLTSQSTVVGEMRKEPHVITIETLLRPEVRCSFKFRVNATVCLEIYDSEKAINV